jgi:hypothetical protein
MCITRCSGRTVRSRPRNETMLVMLSGTLCEHIGTNHVRNMQGRVCPTKLPVRVCACVCIHMNGLRRKCLQFNVVSLLRSCSFLFYSSYQDQTGQTHCVPCAPGSAFGVEGGTACLFCEVRLFLAVVCAHLNLCRSLVCAHRPCTSLFLSSPTVVPNHMYRRSFTHNNCVCVRV